MERRHALAEPRTSSYRLHKASGQAGVAIDGRDFYLGLHGTDESRAACDRLIAEWLANGLRIPIDDAITIEGLVAPHRVHVPVRYRSNEPENIRSAIRPVRRLNGELDARDLGPLALKAIRRGVVGAGIVRTRVNRRVCMILRMFK